MATAVKLKDESQTEVQRIRRDLAACYRLCAIFGWDDHIATHLSARLPDGTFLLNPFGLLFEEITSSSLMRVDMDGNVLEPEGHPMNPAAYEIHSAVLEARPDVNCAMHLHTRDGAAVAAMKEGLLPLNQNALVIHNDVGYHDYEGAVDNRCERERLQSDLGMNRAMILRNHGTLACGPNVGMAFYLMYTLEWACTAQVRTLSMGREVIIPSKEIRDTVGNGMKNPAIVEAFIDKAFWPAMLRKAERDCPGFDA